MENEIKLQDQRFTYQLKTSHRARRMRISVSCDAGVVVTVPYFMPESIFERFVKLKAGWILDKLKYFKKLSLKPSLKVSNCEYKNLKLAAYDFVKDKVEFWNRVYGFSYNRIGIKNQKTRWGSCSRKGNLNFNYKIIHLPEKLADYLVVHELCHLKEMNHGREFWNLVLKTQIDYKNLRKELLDIRLVK